MPALRGTGGITRGTRSPEGSSPARPHGTGIYREVPLWPGVTWGDDSRCLCSWGYLHGVRQVKVQSGACTVHLTGRGPGPVPAPRPAGPPVLTGDEALLQACREGGPAGWAAYRKAVEEWRANDLAVRRARGERLAEEVEEAELVVTWRKRQRPGPRGRLLTRGARPDAARRREAA